MQGAAGTSKPLLSKSANTFRRFEYLAQLKFPGKIEVVDPSCDTSLVVGGALDHDFPISAPGKRSEPDRSIVFCRSALGIQSKPGCLMVAGNASTAFHHFLTLFNHSVVDVEFIRPTSR